MNNNNFKRLCFTITTFLGISLSSIFSTANADNITDKMMELKSQQMLNEQEKLINKADPIIPEGCNLISYTLDGTHFFFKCKEQDIVSTIMFPQDDFSAEILIDKLVKNTNCKATPDKLALGTKLICQEGEYFDTFVATNKSRLISTITAPSSLNDIPTLEHLQNFSYAIYFFKRNIARDYEQIEYFQNLLNQSHGVESVTDLFKFNENETTSENKDKTTNNNK